MNSEIQARTPALSSRLPRVGTTIFTVMSALAAQHNAVNLGQGFPDFACDPSLVDAVTKAMQAGHNQYPPMIGVAVLRQGRVVEAGTAEQIFDRPTQAYTRSLMQAAFALDN